MPISEHKDTTCLAAKTQVFAGDQGHHFDVYLWDNLESMRENADGCDDRTMAIVNHEGDYFEMGEVRRAGRYPGLFGRMVGQ